MSLMQIEIPRRSHHCTECKGQLIHGMDYFSALIDGSSNTYERCDYCPNCWETKNNEEGIHWKSKVPEKQKMAQEEQFKSRNEKALFLLKESLRDGQHIEAFVLALLLSRFKVLAVRQQIEQENMTLYEVLRTEEMLFVPKVALNSIQVEALQTILAQKLKI